MTSKQIEDLQNQAREAAERYQTTVHALLAFSAFVVHDGSEIREQSGFGFGRRMDTSKDNTISPETEITPDLVAQKSPSYGLVGEIKAGFHVSENHWDSQIKRLQKYDDELVGWWTETERVEISDAVLFVDQSKARPFVRYLEEQPDTENNLTKEQTAVVEFNRSDSITTFIFFRREWGAIRDSELRPRLEDGVSIPLHQVLGTFPSVQFYDARPPVHWLMEILWLDAFAARRDPENYDDQKAAWPIEVTVNELTDELQRGFGSKALHYDERSCEFPKPRWIKDALEKFVAIQLAIPHESDPRRYTILFRNIRGDVMSRFVDLLEREKPKREKKSDQQIPLDLQSQEDVEIPSN